MQGVSRAVPVERRVAIRATQPLLEIIDGGCRAFCDVRHSAGSHPGLAADGGKRTPQPARRRAGGTLRVRIQGDLLHNTLAPAPVRQQHFIFLRGEMFTDQPVPVPHVHAVVLANAEALFLMRPNHVTHQIPQQPPVVQLTLPGFHGVVVRAAVEPQAQQAPHRLFRKKEDAAGGQHSFDFQENPFNIQKLAQHLESQHHPEGAIRKRKIHRVARDADRCARHPPGILQCRAIAQRVCRNIQRKAVRAELIRHHVAGMAHISADFEEWGHARPDRTPNGRPDEIEMAADDGAAADVLCRVGAQGALRFPQGSKVVEFDLSSLYGKRLCWFQEGRFKFNARPASEPVKSARGSRSRA